MPPRTSTVTPVLLIHGGAGTLDRAALSAAREAEFRAVLAAALTAGQAVLRDGGTAEDAVVASVRVMEDAPLFNAGRGAVFTSDGRNEMDAAIMRGADRAAGAVAGVTTVRNPVEAARAVMRDGRHVLLIGPGAEAFAREQGLALEDPAYFHTQWRMDQLLAARARDAVQLDHDGAAAVGTHERGAAAAAVGTDGHGAAAGAVDRKFGTVGAVALDVYGNLAAATSTGGMTNKRWGRVGDSPIIGAGTWADDATVAVSATGTGEVFMRVAAAHEIAALVRYRGLSVQQAADEVVQRQIPALGGAGGVIALDARGHAAFSFSTSGMYRGSVRGTGAPQVAIYRD